MTAPERMDPQEAFTAFIAKAGANPNSALSFFVGYAYGATGARVNIDALVEALKSTTPQTGSQE